MSKTSFPLRIQVDERTRAKRLAEAMGVSENRLYAELIHDGLLIPQQPLMPFDATGKLRAAIPFSLEDYLELVEATGRCQHPDKRGKMPEHAPRLLQRLQLEPEQFVECSAKLMLRFGSAVGAPAKLTEYCVARQVKYLRGIGAARRMGERRAA